MDTSAEIDALWDYGNPAESETRFRDALAQAEAAGDDTRALELRTQIARTHSLRRQFKQAHALLDAIQPHLATAPPIVHVRYLLERGRTFNSAGEPATALPLFEEALQRAETAGLDFYAVDAAHMAAIAAPTGQQMAWHERALSLAEGSRQPRARGWRGSLYNNLGWTLHDAGKYEQALGAFQKALDARLEQGSPVAQVRIARWAVARCLRSLGRVEEALEIQETLQRDHAASDTADGYVFEELGECLLALNRPEEARPHFAHAYALLVDEDPERRERLRQLGGVEQADG